MLVNVLLVAVGSAAGGALRYLVGELLQQRVGHIPLATLAVNVVGCFAIGAVVAMTPASSQLRLLLATGVCGGFTTFSAFAIDTLEAGRDGTGTAVVNIALNVVLSIAACWVGLRLASR